MNTPRTKKKRLSPVSTACRKERKSADLAFHTSKECVRCGSRSRISQQVRGASEAHIPFWHQQEERRSELHQHDNSKHEHDTNKAGKVGTPRNVPFLGAGGMSPQKHRAKHAKSLKNKKEKIDGRETNACND